MPKLEPWAATGLSQFSPELVSAIEAAPLPGLRGGPTDAALTSILQRSADAELLGDLPSDRQALCRSGLWLLAGNLDRSHSISQDIKDSNGSFWHGIMHRREGDFGNAKYWFRRVGSHPVFEELAKRSDSYQDPFQFVDACSEASRVDDDAYAACQKIQWLEWQTLIVHCVCG